MKTTAPGQSSATGRRKGAQNVSNVLDTAGELVYPVCLAGVLGFSLRYLWPFLFRTWFYNSDEYVFAAEVIRFLRLDFHQQFVDMPGTPMMVLAAVIWALYFLAQGATGHFPMERGIDDFTFQHLPGLFVMLRGLTLLCFALSLVLLFVLASRLMNRPAAVIATLIFGMSATYAYIGSFVRVEPLALCLMLAGLLVLVRAIDGRAADRADEDRPFWRFDRFLLAGMLVGLAAATRLHSITASVPVLVLSMLFAGPRPTAPFYERSVRIAALAALMILAALAFLVLTKWRPVFNGMPHAYSMIRATLIGGTAVFASITALYAMTATRPWVTRVLSPALVRTLLGCGVGLLVGAATIPRQYPFFLRSMEMYDTSYRDVTRLDWPFLKNVVWYVNHYLAIVAPDPIVLALLAIGSILIVVRLDRKLLPFLLAAVLFFVSKPLNLTPSAHHVLPWLPFFAIVVAYPFAFLQDLLAKKWSSRSVSRVVVFVVCFAALCRVVTPGPKLLAQSLPDSEERLGNVRLASSWIKEHAERQTTVAVTYYCFNPDIFYTWLRSLDVDVPASALDGRAYVTWWGAQSALQGLEGYVCTSPLDGALKPSVDQRNAGNATDPRFQLMQSFGKDANQIQIYRFDFTDPLPDPAVATDVSANGSPAGSSGIHVLAATYGQSCFGTTLPHGATNRVRPGNATRLVGNECNGHNPCDFTVALERLGDPAPYCGKDFRVEWSCPDGDIHEVTTPAEAASAVVRLQCASEATKAY